MGKVKRPAYEVVIVTIVVALSVLISAGLYAGRVKVEKSGMLVNELAMFRSSLIHYKLINKKNPESLMELGSAAYDAGSIQKPYLDKLPKTKNGDVIDPFGSPYKYDPKSGWLCSTTEGFERW